MAIVYTKPSQIIPPNSGETFSFDLKVRNIQRLGYFSIVIKYDVSVIAFLSKEDQTDVFGTISSKVSTVSGSQRELEIQSMGQPSLSDAPSGDILLSTLRFSVVEKRVSQLIIDTASTFIRTYNADGSGPDERDETTEVLSLILSSPTEMYAYKDKPFIFKVLFGDEDVTGLVTELNGLTSQVDVNVPTSFQRPAVNLTLRDDSRGEQNSGTYNPHNPSNWFTANGHNQTGYLAPVKIQLGYYVDGEEKLEPWFDGLIDKINQNVKPGHLLITFSDQSIGLRKDKVQNFGLQKYLTLEAGDFRLNGSYPLPGVLSEMSDGSFSRNIISQYTNAGWKTLGNLEDLGIRNIGTITIGTSFPSTSKDDDVFISTSTDTIGDVSQYSVGTWVIRKNLRDFDGVETLSTIHSTEGSRIPPSVPGVSLNDIFILIISPLLRTVETLKTEGYLDSTNVLPSGDKLETEGDLLNSDPPVSFKSPLKWKRIDTCVEDVLSQYNITDPDIQIDDIILDEKIVSTYGRVGFDIENSEPLEIATNFRWTGHVTDWIVDDDDFYFLYSRRGASPRIIKYDNLTDTWSQIVKRSSESEWWKIAKHGNDFYVLGTKGFNNPEIPVLGVYDPTDLNDAQRDGPVIEKIEHNSDNTYSVGEYITALYHETASEDAKLMNPTGAAMYYHFGFNAADNLKTGIKPDSRKGFEIHNNYLYYLFANRLGFGIARVNLNDPPTGGSPVSDANAGGKINRYIDLTGPGRWAHLSHDFVIAKDVDISGVAYDFLFGSVCFQKNNESQFQVFRKQLL